MKYFAILTVLILIVTLGGVGYMYMTSNVVIEATGLIAIDAQSQTELFDSLRDQVRLGSVIGTPYTNAKELTGPEDYQFYTYTVRLRNDCAVTADMVELQVTPMSGDILQIGAYEDVKVPAGETRDIQCTILTEKGKHGIREVNVTYYIWGAPFTLRTTIN